MPASEISKKLQRLSFLLADSDTRSAGSVKNEYKGYCDFQGLTYDDSPGSRKNIETIIHCLTSVGLLSKEHTFDLQKFHDMSHEPNHILLDPDSTKIIAEITQNKGNKKISFGLRLYPYEYEKDATEFAKKLDEAIASLEKRKDSLVTSTANAPNNKTWLEWLGIGKEGDSAIERVKHHLITQLREEGCQPVHIEIENDGEVNSLIRITLKRPQKKQECEELKKRIETRMIGSSIIITGYDVSSNPEDIIVLIEGDILKIAKKLPQLNVSGMTK